MSNKRELRDLLRRLIVANLMIGQFMFDVARYNLSMDEAESFLKKPIPKRTKRTKAAETDGWT